MWLEEEPSFSISLPTDLLRLIFFPLIDLRMRTKTSQYKFCADWNFTDFRNIDREYFKKGSFLNAYSKFMNPTVWKMVDSYNHIPGNYDSVVFLKEFWSECWYSDRLDRETEPNPNFPQEHFEAQDHIMKRRAKKENSRLPLGIYY